MAMRQVKKKTNTHRPQPVPKNQKRTKDDTEDDDDDDDDKVQLNNNTTVRTKVSTAKKAVVPSKKDLSSSEEDDDDDDDDDDDSRENGSDEDNDDNDDKKDNSAKKVTTNSQQRQQSMSDDDDDDDELDDSDDDDNENVNNRRGFTDENASWLKPKINSKHNNNSKKEQLLSSDDEDVDMDDDDDEDELLEIERQSKLVDAEMEEEQEEADEEMKKTITENTSIYHLPTEEEIEQYDSNRVVPPSEVRVHIESILEVLADFKHRREEGRSRKEYIDRLGLYLAELHGYLPELTEYFLTMFSPAEAVEFVNASDKPRPLVIRTNTLKTRRKDLAAALIKRGVTLDPLASWSKVGIKIVDSPVPIGATPEYLSGMYMLQSAASMCPVLALAPEPNEKVLDMSAAPGGKTSYIAQLMRNTGVVIANDLKPERQKATVANMHRLGVKNVITCTYDGRKLGKEFLNRFDRILLDAPCSGLGVISRDPSVKVQRTIADIQQNAQLQKELLLNAIDALKYKNTTGGVMVYSTCSVSVYENEEVIQYALNKRDIQILDTGLDFGSSGFTRYQNRRFHPSMTLCKRFYPHTVNMDGFFVCKIKKLSNEHRNIKDKNDEVDTTTEKADTKAKSSKSTIENKNQAKGVKNSKEHAKAAGAVVVAAVSKKTKGKKGSQKRKDDNTKDDANDKNNNETASKTKKQRLNAKVTKPRRLNKKNMTVPSEA